MPLLYITIILQYSIFCAFNSQVVVRVDTEQQARPEEETEGVVPGGARSRHGRAYEGVVSVARAHDLPERLRSLRYYVIVVITLYI